MKVFVVVSAMQTFADLTGGFFLPKPAPELNPSVVDASCRVFQEDQDAVRLANARAIAERKARRKPEAA